MKMNSFLLILILLKFTSAAVKIDLIKIDNSKTIEQQLKSLKVHSIMAMDQNIDKLKELLELKNINYGIVMGYNMDPKKYVVYKDGRVVKYDESNIGDGYLFILDSESEQKKDIKRNELSNNSEELSYKSESDESIKDKNIKNIKNTNIDNINASNDRNENMKVSENKNKFEIEDIEVEVFIIEEDKNSSDNKKHGKNDISDAYSYFSCKGSDVILCRECYCDVSECNDYISSCSDEYYSTTSSCSW